jgi:2-polyprenyl-3-methyl-5-hydroxy-6-metoxy-1,4-benzoquinol methylase
MNTLKKIWKTKIRVLLPEQIKETLSFIGNGFRTTGYWQTSNRDEFLAKISQLDNTNPPAQAWWGKQKKWKASNTTFVRYDRLVDFIRKNFEPCLKTDYVVCDLACACGEFSFLIASKVNTIEAFDLADGMVKTAKKIAQRKNINNIIFKQADILETVLQQDKYDAFMMLGLLTCIDDPHIDEILKNVHDSMKQGATLIVKDSITHEKSTQYVYDGNSGYSAYYRTEKNYIDLYEQNGFKFINSTYLDEECISFSGIFIRV